MENSSLNDDFPEEILPTSDYEDDEPAGPEDIRPEIFAPAAPVTDPQPVETVEPLAAEDPAETANLPVEPAEIKPEQGLENVAPVDVAAPPFHPASDEIAGEPALTKPVAGQQEIDIEDPLPDQHPVSDSQSASPGALLQEEGTADEIAPAQAITAGGSPPVPAQPQRRRRRFAWLLTIFLGAFILLLIAALSAYGGYNSGIAERKVAEGTLVAQTVQEHFDLGVQQIQEGNYFRARQHLEYVISLKPDYPGALELLSEVLFELNTTATPTLVPAPTLTPTPDLRDVQQRFDEAQQLLNDGNWTTTIDTLLALRKANAEFQAVQVDGMLFLALRNRGKDKILLEADLEGGIYDLTLAEGFGPLDTEAQSLLDGASIYITGASFWEIDWGQAASYFGQVARNLPNLRDKSGWTATERYRLSLVNYAYQLADQKKWCQSAEQFRYVLEIAPDPEIEQSLAVALQRCEEQKSPKNPPTPTP